MKAIDLLKRFIESGRDEFPTVYSPASQEYTNVWFYFEEANIRFTLRNTNLQIIIDCPKNRAGVYNETNSLSYAECDFVREWLYRMKEAEKANCLKAFNNIILPGGVKFDPNCL